MATDLFLHLINVSIGVGLTSIILWIFTPLFIKKYAFTWKYLACFFLTLRLLIPFTFPFSKNLSAIRLLQDFLQRHAWLFYVWAAGIVIVLVMHLLTYRAFRKQCLHWSVPISHPDTQELLDQLFAEMKIAPVKTLVSMKVPSPMVIGVFKPILILPHENYLQGDAYCILCHALMHYKHRDIWYKTLMLFACALHWFNPAVWLMRYDAYANLELLRDHQLLGTSIEVGGVKV